MIRHVTTKPTQEVGREAKVVQIMKKRIMRDRVKGFREVKKYPTNRFIRFKGV